MERLTARSPQNGLAYLVKVKPDEQAVDSAYPNTLRCILEAFNRLAEYEEAEERMEQTKRKEPFGKGLLDIDLLEWMSEAQKGREG